MSNYSIYLGAIGWNHPHWRGDFYPEDMPEDWLLAFYNSQFRCVYLPYETWSKASDDEISDWVRETREGFLFVLEAPGSQDEKRSLFAERFGKRGIFEDKAEIVWLEKEAALRDLSRRIQKAMQSGMPLFLISRDGSMAHMRQVKELMEVMGV